MAQLTFNTPAPRVAAPRQNILTLLLLWVSLPVLLVVGAVGAFEYHYRDRIYPGVQVGGIDLSGMTLIEAEQALNKGMTPYAAPPISLRLGERSWQLSAADLGVHVDAKSSVTQAYMIGRGNQLEDDLRTQVRTWQEGKEIAPAVTVDDGAVNYALARVARDVDHPLREATLNVQNLQVQVTAGAAGEEVDIPATRAALLAQINRSTEGVSGVVNVSTQTTQPQLTDLASTQARIERIISNPLVFTDGTPGGLRFALDRAKLARLVKLQTVKADTGAVSIEPVLDQDAVKAEVEQIAKSVATPAQEAVLDWNTTTNQVVVRTPSQNGRRLDVVETTKRVLSQALTDNREVPLALSLVKARISSDDVASLGIKEIVGDATTSFAGSSADRIHNVATAASRFQAVVVPPGEVLSFDDYLGDVTAATGYVEGLIIAGDRTAVGIGGGVCQVSTTLFRSAYLAGFPIAERYNHGYVVTYYGEPGLDATVYSPTVDFKFKNDTPNYLLIKSFMNSDPKKPSLTFRIYGTKTGRTAEVSAPKITNVTKPGPAVYEKDDSLPAGTIKQVDWAHDGMDVTVTRTIKQDGNVVRVETLHSHYDPWKSVYNYGSGAAIPQASASQPSG